MYGPQIQRRNRLVIIFLILAAFYLGVQAERRGWISPWHEPADVQQTFSAAILAGAIQDHERGKLIGTRTFGTGTVLTEFQLTDGSAVLLATSEWLTPKGRQIWHKGISPDIEVSLPQDASIVLPQSEMKRTADELAHSDDTQLLKAIEVMKQELK